MSDLLHVDGLYMQFGGLVAVDNVSFSVHPKQIYSIIGSNGAGKTTIFNCISGFYKPTGGEITFNHRAIQGLPSHKIAQLGLMRTFQNIRLFKNMTVLENLLVAQHTQLVTGLFSGLVKTKSFRQSEKRAIEKAIYWLKRMGLWEFAEREAGNLSYGQQRRLEIARCMIIEPRLLILDEPAAGLNPQETAELVQIIYDIRNDYGVAVLLIEHDMSLVMEISEEILVVEYGRPLAQGSPEEIQANPEVIKAYLGEE